MTRSTGSRRRLPFCVALLFAAFASARAGNAQTAAEDTGLIPLPAQDRRAEEYYREKAPKLASRTNAVPSSPENAALLYYQALLAYREPDPRTARILNDVARGGKPDTQLRIYLGRSLNAIEMAQVASLVPECRWGPMWAGEQQLDFNVGIPLRRLSRLLDADARTLAADGHPRAALARCLTIRRLAHHTGDQTYNLYSISQSIHTLALLAIAHTLGTEPADSETLTWLKNQLAAVPGTSFDPARALRQWRDAELKFWRTRPRGHPFTRELVLEKARNADDRQALATLTDEQLLVLALQGERRVPGLYGVSAPPELLDRAQQACDAFLKSALQIMQADLPYAQKHARLQEMAASLDNRALDGDPIALLSEAPKVVEIYHRLMVRNAVYDNLIATALEISLRKANTGDLPPGLPKDLYTDKGFNYERTTNSFVLRFDPENLSRIRARQFEFRTR